MQMGIGAIPDGCPLLPEGTRRTSAFTRRCSRTAVIELYEKGVVTGEKKTIDKGRWSAGFLIGSKRLYDFVRQQTRSSRCGPTRVSFTTRTCIRRYDKMVAINSALEVDLTGQVCADSIGPRLYSGVRGQLDFIQEGGPLAGGKPIIGLPSSARGEGRRGLFARRVDAETRGRGRQRHGTTSTTCHRVRRRRISTAGRFVSAPRPSSTSRTPTSLGAGAKGDRAEVPLSRPFETPKAARLPAVRLRTSKGGSFRASDRIRPSTMVSWIPVRSGLQSLVRACTTRECRLVAAETRRRSSNTCAPDRCRGCRVGSSARTREGSRTRARATATRCCWPPRVSSRGRRPGRRGRSPRGRVKARSLIPFSSRLPAGASASSRFRGGEPGRRWCELEDEYRASFPAGRSGRPRTGPSCRRPARRSGGGGRSRGRGG